mmetsp:Transcript_3401/g.9518  ORF Transcript_3401/g.9518 Transcript_3401/m.9518 type:complete len:133 (-) Transcript_3401:751-1149(-)
MNPNHAQESCTLVSRVALNCFLFPNFQAHYLDHFFALSTFQISSDTIQDSRQIHIREFFNSRTKISVAPTSWRASILSLTSFFRTRDDTDLVLPHSRFVMVGDFFPGVILMASAIKSLETLYMIMTYFIAVM